MIIDLVSIWDVLSASCRVAVAVIVVVKLVFFYDHYHRLERFGLGVAGGCSLLTVPVAIYGGQSPFSEWTYAAFAFGIMLYFLGRLQRQVSHARANREANRIALERKRGRVDPTKSAALNTADVAVEDAKQVLASTEETREEVKISEKGG